MTDLRFTWRRWISTFLGTDFKMRLLIFKAMERRLEIHEAALQASLDEIAPLDARAKAIKPADMIDRRYLVELEKSGAFSK